MFKVKLYAKHIGKSPEQIEADIRRPKYFSPSEAVEYGIIDKVPLVEWINSNSVWLSWCVQPFLSILFRYYTMKGPLRTGELLLTWKKLNSFDGLGPEMMIVTNSQVNSMLITLNCLLAIYAELLLNVCGGWQLMRNIIPLVSRTPYVICDKLQYIDYATQFLPYLNQACGHPRVGNWDHKISPVPACLIKFVFECDLLPISHGPLVCLMLGKDKWPDSEIPIIFSSESIILERMLPNGPPMGGWGKTRQASPWKDGQRHRDSD